MCGVGWGGGLCSVQGLGCTNWVVTGDWRLDCTYALEHSSHKSSASPQLSPIGNTQVKPWLIYPIDINDECM